jgi:hypothetical protein
MQLSGLFVDLVVFVHTGQFGTGAQPLDFRVPAHGPACLIQSKACDTYLLTQPSSAQCFYANHGQPSAKIETPADKGRYRCCSS